MTTKPLALSSAIVALVGGLLTLFTFWTYVFPILIGIVFVVLGILGLVYYTDRARVSLAPHILLIVAGGITLIPFIGAIAAGIIAIIGGALYFVSLSKLD